MEVHSYRIQLEYQVLFVTHNEDKILSKQRGINDFHNRVRCVVVKLSVELTCH